MTNESGTLRRVTGEFNPFEALGDPTRRTIFELLCRGPQSVGQLAALVPVSRPAVSQHLKVLKAAGMVTDEAHGTRRIYRVASAGVEQLRTYVDELWDTALAGFASAVEEEARNMASEKTEVGIIEPVKKTMLVAAPVEVAFEVFTERLSEWWPLATHSIGDEDTVSAHIEGRVGGRVYEIQQDGGQADWGVVSVWEPPHRLEMEWKVNPAAPAPTVIDVRFTDEGGSTRVDLEHSHWERLGANGQEARDNYNSGWDLVLSGYRSAAGER